MPKKIGKQQRQEKLNRPNKKLMQKERWNSWKLDDKHIWISWKYRKKSKSVNNSKIKRKEKENKRGKLWRIRPL